MTDLAWRYLVGYVENACHIYEQIQMLMLLADFFSSCLQAIAGLMKLSL